MSELVLKEKNQPSVNVNRFDGIVSIQKLQLSIKETLATNDELYFIDEIEKIVYKIGNNIFDKIKQNLDQKNEFYNQWIDKINFNTKYLNYEFNKEFDKEFIKENFNFKTDISDDIQKIKANLNKLRSSLLPVAIITDAKINAVIPVICKLIINTTFYGKKDNDTIFKNAKALVEDIEEFSYYAIQRGVKEYCRNNKDYPALKDLVDVIQPKHNKGLMLFANIQFLLSL